MKWHKFVKNIGAGINNKKKTQQSAQHTLIILQQNLETYKNSSSGYKVQSPKASGKNMD